MFLRHKLLSENKNEMGENRGQTKRFRTHVQINYFLILNYILVYYFTVISKHPV